MVAGDSRITAAITVVDEDSYRGDLKIEFPSSPKNGIVAVSSDKETLIYRADDGFVGEDSFTVRVSDGFNYSEEISVTVTVEPNSAQTVSQQESDVSEITEENDKKDNSIWIVIIFSLVGAAFAVVVILQVIKNKKR
jgi:VCBS repeat-containing protein